MDFYAAELVLTDQLVLLVGGGQVAARKLTGLTGCHPRLIVVAPVLCPDLVQSLAAGVFHHEAANYHGDHLLQWGRPRLVFAATSSRPVNQAVAHQCRELDILCNVVDDPAASGFLVPAVIRRGPVTVAVSTGGNSPALARALKAWLEDRLPAGWGRLAEAFGSLRAEVRGRMADHRQRETFWRETALAALQEKQFDNREARHWLQQRLANFCQHRNKA